MRVLKHANNKKEHIIINTLKLYTKRGKQTLKQTIIKTLQSRRKLTSKRRERFVLHFPVLHFPVLHFPALLFGPPNSSPAFSVAAMCHWIRQVYLPNSI